MEILSASEDGIRFLGLVGAFDTPEVDAFNAHVDSAIDEQHFKICLNVGQMTFINSTALGALIRAQKRLKQYGGDLAVAELQGFAVQVFKTLGIDRKIKCLPSEAEAVTFLRTVGAEGVGVDGDVQVAFSFPEAAMQNVAGSDARIGKMKTIGDQGLSFQWENLDALDTEKMFAAGTRIRIRFQLPLYHETHTFQADGSVGSAEITAGNKALVVVKFDSLRDVEKKAIQQYVRDLRYLKGEIG